MISFNRKAMILLLSLLALIPLTACSRHFPPEQYWQRSNTSSFAMVRGPKAQQLLHKDIRNCVHELKELESLNEIHNPIQTSYNERIIPSDPLALSGSNNTALLAGQYSYNDFDGCMYAKGWERTHYVPYHQRITADDLRIRRQPQTKPWNFSSNPESNDAHDGEFNQ